MPRDVIQIAAERDIRRPAQRLKIRAGQPKAFVARKAERRRQESRLPVALVRSVSRRNGTGTRGTSLMRNLAFFNLILSLILIRA